MEHPEGHTQVIDQRGFGCERNRAHEEAFKLKAPFQIHRLVWPACWTDLYGSMDPHEPIRQPPRGPEERKGLTSTSTPISATDPLQGLSVLAKIPWRFPGCRCKTKTIPQQINNPLGKIDVEPRPARLP